MNLLRSCAGRITACAWRSRKYVVWTVGFLALIFFVYVEFTPGPNGIFEGDAQKHRSLHSFRRQKPEEMRKPERVRFIENDYIKHVAVKKTRDEGEENALPQVNGLFARQREIKNKPQVYSGLGNAPEENLVPIFHMNREHIPQPQLNLPQNDGYEGNAASAWNGGSFRYNIFGQPVYNHDNRPNYIPKERMVHLDLKGAPPLPSVYKTLIPWLAKGGATSILLEYEDMFPWGGILAQLAAKNHYTKAVVKEILNLCEANSISVVPLVQTFGHLELALKLPKFSYLREVTQMPQALCPSHNDSLWLVRTMIDQVMAVHEGAKFLHIGSDEVFQIGECERCRLKARENLFLDHVTAVAKYARSKHGVIPIIWHDMLTHVSEATMRDYNFGELVEPMIWVYAEDVYRFVQPTAFTKLAQVFPRAWAASAFKGAFGEQSTVPNVRRHLDNNLNWLDVMASESPKFSEGFRGLVLTGWQRHDHFAVLCELFPAALPSLAVNLAAASSGFFNASVHQKIYESLNCIQTPKYQTGLNLESDPFLWDKFSWCFFPGALIFKTTARLDSARRDIRSFIDRVTLKRAWISAYNRRHNFSSPMRIDEDLEELPSRVHTVTLLLKTAKEALSEWYDDWTVGEWVEQHIWPMLKELQDLQKESESMKLVKTWPARPLPLLPELKEFGIKEPGAVDDKSLSGIADPQSVRIANSYDGEKRKSYYMQ